METRKMKIVILGDSRVGKTCLCCTFANNIFPECVPQSFDPFPVVLKAGDIDVELDLWDITDFGDINHLQDISSPLYRKTSIFIICFSIASKMSFENVSTKWLPAIKKRNDMYKIQL